MDADQNPELNQNQRPKLPPTQNSELSNTNNSNYLIRDPSFVFASPLVQTLSHDVGEKPNLTLETEEEAWNQKRIRSVQFSSEPPQDVQTEV